MNPNTHKNCIHIFIFNGQSGMALIIALIVLVAMSLAGIALVRSIDTSVLIAGNLAFRQGATTAGDAGVEAARKWVLSNVTTLINDNAAQGYYSIRKTGLDLTGNLTPADKADDVGWDETGENRAKCLSPDNAGNTVCYIIHRLCDATGAINSTGCSVKLTARTGNSFGARRQMETYQPGGWGEAATQTYYRITVRIQGPRNNTSFIQTFMLI